jgi:rare lipoprotein A
MGAGMGRGSCAWIAPITPIAFAAALAACATERGPSAPAASHAARAESVPPQRRPPESVPAEPAPPAGADEQRLESTYGGRRALAVQNGQASYYGNSLAGHKTASGERYDPHAFTAAHRTLALGSVARVRRSDTGAIVYVRITDRGPYASTHRIIDLSHAAAERLGMIRSGVAEVRLEVLEYGRGRTRRRR